MNQNKDLVSVILPCFNKQEFLEDAVKSILLQTYATFELIIIDDCSTDKSSELLLALEKLDRRIRVILNTSNRGANFCRNEGVKQSMGDFVLFFDADDLLAPHCLERRLEVLADDPSLDFCVCTMQNFKNEIGDLQTFWRPVSNNLLKDFLIHDLPFQTMQPLWRKRAVIKVGGWDESLVRLQDVDFHTRVLLLNDSRYKLIIREPDCYYRISEARISSTYSFFIAKWIQGALDYCTKFEVLLPSPLRKYLIGTLFQTYLSLLLANKAGKIEDKFCCAQEDYIFSHIIFRQASAFTKFCFKISKFYNLRSPRIPGFNRFIKKVILRGS